MPDVFQKARNSGTKGGIDVTYLSVLDASLRLGVSERTVRVWTDRGLLPALRTENGRRFLRADDVQRLAQQRCARQQTAAGKR